jgi:hypothetical protein
MWNKGGGAYGPVMKVRFQSEYRERFFGKVIKTMVIGSISIDYFTVIQKRK